MASAPPTAPGLPVLGNTLGVARGLVSFWDRAIEECGDVVTARTLGLGTFYGLGHPDHVERVLVTERDRFEKTEDFRIAFGDNVISADGERWRRHRDPMDAFFTPEKIHGYAAEMVTLTERRVGRWRDGETLSLASELTDLAMENLCGTLFDLRLDLDGHDDLRRAANDLNRWFAPTSWVLPEWIPTPARRRFADAVETLEAEAERLLDRAAARRRGPSEAPGGDDLLTALARPETEDAPSREAVVDDVVGLVFAGHDTTALSMTYALHLLGTHPEVRERFHAEVDEVLGSDRPGVGDLDELACTRRIVDEALRLYPPVHTLPRRTREPVRFEGYEIPAGARVQLPIFRLHRDERFWDRPEAFHPRRWGDVAPTDRGYEYAPFGAGPRTCLGRRFARLEATLVLATIGQRYRIEPLEDLGIAPEMTLQPAGDVPVRVHER